MLRKIALLGAAILISSAASAAVPVLAPPGTDLTSWPLGGITAFEVDVEPLSQSAASCGITSDRLDTSLRFVLGQSRIRTLSQSVGLDNEGIIFLRVTVLPNCARNITLKADTRVTILGTNRFTLATVWEDGFVGTGGDAAKAASDAVELLAKELVNAWNTANPPS